MFEGINFMSRKAEMTEAEMAAMHARAEKAGMYPCKCNEQSLHRRLSFHLNAHSRVLFSH